MLQLFFAVAFSAAPLTLYIPSIRSLNLFIETAELFLRPAFSYALTIYPRLRLAVSAFLSTHLAAAAAGGR